MEKIDGKALFKISYGLYVVTCNDGEKDNGLIVNTVVQAAGNPLTVTVAINKENYSHGVIKETRKMNVNCLTVNTPFSVFENFGFQSGRNANKFKDFFHWKSENGLAVLSGEIVNAFFSLEVTDYVDLGSHGLFICRVTEATHMCDDESLTYDYYQRNIKPKKAAKKSGYVCKVCGYVHEGDTLPDDFICPICKHGAIDFEKIS